MMRLALGIGLTRLDESAYHWDGDCPGCDRDVLRVTVRAHERGFDGVSAMVNAMACTATISPFFEATVGRLHAGDLLLLYASGHGGQKRDRNHDEADGLDETLLLWDKEVLDDVIAAHLNKVPHGVRVWFITDSCHSETVHRGAPMGAFRTPDYHSPLLHWAGCEDDSYSYGSDAGGAFTLAWMDADARAKRAMSYSELFDRIAGRMDGEMQTPQMVVEAGFDVNKEAWT
jgi:hypothetical protein